MSILPMWPGEQIQTASRAPAPLTTAEKNARDHAQRLATLQRCKDRGETLDREFAGVLDAMDADELRLLFDAAFGGVADFEWGLRVRSGRISMPQRFALLEELAKREARRA